MDDNELRKHLLQLHDEIKNTQTVDEKGSELLRDLDADIQDLLERSEENPAQTHSSLIRRLEGAFEHFEVSHPDLTKAISNLLDTLSNAGI
jgi:uncharacterized membrane protein YukC